MASAEAKAKEKALARGLNGVLVYEYGFTNNGRMLAGHLGLSNTKDLRALVASDAVKVIIKPWVEAGKRDLVS